MAVTKILAKDMRLDKLINYVGNKDKTEEKTLLTCLLCDYEEAAHQMMDTKRRYGKTGGVQAYHIVQAFMPHEISPEDAHELGVRFTEEFLPGYEVVIGTHVDKDHIHNHIAFNSVSLETGIKYTNTYTDYYKGIRRVSDKLCAEKGLSVIMETGGKGLHYAEWKMRQAGLLTFRELFEADLQEALAFALDIGNFYEIMEDRGYTIEHHSKYPSFVPHGSTGHYRAKIDGKSLTEDDIRDYIEKGFNEDKPVVLVPKHRPEFIPFGKQKGFRALYVSWMYVLGIIGKGGSTPYPKVNRGDLRRFEQYKQQADYLEANKIDTPEQLADKKELLSTHIDALTKDRIILNQKKKRQKKLYDALSHIEYFADMGKLYKEGAAIDESEYKLYLDAKKLLDGKDVPALKAEKADMYTKLSDINAEIRNARKEIHMCELIEKDAPKIEDALHDDVPERSENKAR